MSQQGFFGPSSTYVDPYTTGARQAGLDPRDPDFITRYQAFINSSPSSQAITTQINSIQQRMAALQRQLMLPVGADGYLSRTAPTGLGNTARKSPYDQVRDEYEDLV